MSLLGIGIVIQRINAYDESIGYALYASLAQLEYVWKDERKVINVLKRIIAKNGTPDNPLQV